jgi:hypothetical protein
VPLSPSLLVSIASSCLLELSNQPKKPVLLILSVSQPTHEVQIKVLSVGTTYDWIPGVEATMLVEWFVEFCQVRAKTAGASRTYETEVDKPLGLTLGQNPGGRVVITVQKQTIFTCVILFRKIIRHYCNAQTLGASASCWLTSNQNHQKVQNTTDDPHMCFSKVSDFLMKLCRRLLGHIIDWDCRLSKCTS